MQCLFRLTQPRARLELRAAKKFLCAQPLLAFELHFEQFKPRAARTSNQEAMIVDGDVAGLRIAQALRRRRSSSEPMDDELFPLEPCERPRPRLKSAPAIHEFAGS